MTSKQLKAMKMALNVLKMNSSDLHSEWGGPWNGETKLKELKGTVITDLEEALAEHAMRETQRLGQEIEQEPLEYWNAVEGWVKIDEVREHFDSVGCGTIYKTAGDGRVPLCLAQTEQEPVAWIHNFIDGGISIGKRPADLERHPDRWTALYKEPKPCPTCEALARTVMLDQTSHDTTPPQRKPLSAEQVSEICAEWTDENGNTGSFGRRQIARAIEAAHGIKENT